MTAARSLRGRIDRPIVLVGLMGVGKSSVGRKLAQRLSLPFVDADDAIEEAHDLSIAEIFEKFGEPYFRDGERRVIARLMDERPRVIATGGGAFMQGETRALILKHAFSIWIDASIDTLVNRVARRNSRPLLIGRDPGQVLRELAVVRNPVYAQADLRVQSDDVPHEVMVDRIIAALTTAKAEEKDERHEP
jgi:shikimate kinase